jgi:hypothetical protein
MMAVEPRPDNAVMTEVVPQKMVAVYDQYKVYILAAAKKYDLDAPEAPELTEPIQPDNATPDNQ